MNNDKYFVAMKKAEKAWEEYKALYADNKYPSLASAQEALWHNYCEEALKHLSTSKTEDA